MWEREKFTLFLKMTYNRMDKVLIHSLHPILVEPIKVLERFDKATLGLTHPINILGSTQLVSHLSLAKQLYRQTANHFLTILLSNF